MNNDEIINKIKSVVDDTNISAKGKAIQIVEVFDSNIVEPDLTVAFSILDSLSEMSKETDKNIHEFMSKIKGNPCFEYAKDIIGHRQALDAATTVMIEFIQQYDPEKYTVMDYNLITTKLCKHGAFPESDRLYFMIKGFSPCEERRVTFGEVAALRDKIADEIKSLCHYVGNTNSNHEEVCNAATAINTFNKVLTLCHLYLAND